MHQPAFIINQHFWKHPNLGVIPDSSSCYPHIQSGWHILWNLPPFSASSSAPWPGKAVVPSITRVVHLSPPQAHFLSLTSTPYTDPYTVARWFTSGYKEYWYFSLQLKAVLPLPTCRNRGQSPHVAFMPTTMCLGFLSEFAFIRPVLLLSLKCREPSQTELLHLCFPPETFLPCDVRGIAAQPSQSLLKHHCKRGPP